MPHIAHVLGFSRVSRKGRNWPIVSCETLASISAALFSAQFFFKEHYKKNNIVATPNKVQNPFGGGSKWVLLRLSASTESKIGGMLQSVQDYYYIGNFLSQEFS